MAKLIATGLASAALLVAIFNLAGKGLGFIREILFANYFGLSQNFDLYLVAAILPLTINTIILNIAINYFIPAYLRIKQNSTDQSLIFFNKIFLLFTTAGVIVSVILLFTVEDILSIYIPGASKEVLTSASIIFQLLLITIPITAGMSILISFLQAEYKFKTPAISQIILNIIFIILLITLNKQTGILAIPVAYICGLVAQFIYLFKYCPKPETLNILRMDVSTRIIANDLTLFASIVLIETIGQLYFLTDRYFYTSVDPGGIAALNFSFNLFVLPVSILSLALTTVLFPRFSETLIKPDLSEFRQSLSQSINITLLIFIPITILLILSGDLIIRILYERGNFTPEDTRMTQLVLRIYSYSLPLYALYAILNKIFYGSGRVKSLLLLTISGIAIKIALNFITVESYLQEGLAFGTTISYSFFFIISLLMLKNFIGREILKQNIKTILILVPAFLLSYYISNIACDIIISDYLWKGSIKIILFLTFCYISIRVILPSVLNNIHSLISDLKNKYYPEIIR